MADDIAAGRQFAEVRLRRNLRQADVARRARVSRATVSRLESGRLEGLTIATIRSLSRALDMPALVTLGWRGPEVDRLRDEVHSAMVERVVATLDPLGWRTIPEYSFSHYGERGAVDVLAWHASTSALLIVETKSRIVDLQATLSVLDRKRRLLPRIATRELGWHATRLGAVLVLPETASSRRLLARRGATLRSALTEGHVAVRHWLAHPDGHLRGIWFLDIAHEVNVSQRARLKRSRTRRTGVADCSAGAPGNPDPFRGTLAAGGASQDDRPPVDGNR